MKKRWLALIALLPVLPSIAQDTAPKVSLAAPEIYLIGSVHHMHFEDRYHYSLTDLEPV
jgi:hypothetical protein